MPQPARIVVESPKGEVSLRVDGVARTEPLTAILRRQDLPLNTRCGQRGLCDGCLVELVAGKLVAVADRKVIQAGAEPVLLRACMYRLVDSPEEIRLRLPARSLLGHEPQVLVDFKIKVPYAHDPLLSLSTDGKTALGVAVDIGTTTVALLLVDLRTGNIIGRATGFNRQMHLGDDVITRINLCQTDPTMLAKLQAEVVEHTIKPLVLQALRELGHDALQRHQLVVMSVAGNTTMMHILAGIDPLSLGIAPFTPVFLDHRTLPASAIGLRWSGEADAPAQPDTQVHLLPGASAYVGADLMAGLLASGMAYEEGPCLLVDAGTNGEMLLKHGSHIFGCATAAGPAFEGARLASGIRAGRGAISQIRFAVEPFAIHMQVIGADRPIGLCGSAYIDFLAEARRIGLITAAGRFEPDAVDGTRDHLVFEGEQAVALRISHGRGRQDLVITEGDIASLLQAKAAIAAGVCMLLEQAKLLPSDVKKLYLAGGFGTHMDHHNAIACGMLPGFLDEQVEVVGNSSLGGAMMALMDRSSLDEMKKWAQRIEVLELNQLPGFEDRYIDHLMLP